VANNNFYPSKSFIEDITNDLNATITFTEDHDFTPGEIVSFRVEKQFGMSEINNIRATVMLTTSNSVTVPVNTLTWTPFSLANLNQPGTSPPCCVPSASGVIPFEDDPARVTLFDAFDNRPI
jgi:hypothetical protein